MNTSIFPAMESRRSLLLNFPLFLALAIAGMAATASAQTTYYWDGNGAATGSGATTLAGNWGGGSASAYWGTVAAGTSATTAAGLTSLDTAVFAANDGSGAANNWNAAYIVTLGAAQSVNGLVIAGASVGSGNTGGNLTLAGTGSPGLTIGAGGVTVNGSNGDPTFAATLGTIILGADQTWNVNNAHKYIVNAAVAGNATAGNTRTWTFGYLSPYTNDYAGVLSNGSGGGELAITVNNFNGTSGGAGVQNISGVANTFSGKTTITRGILQIASLKNVGGGSSSLGAVTTVGNGTIDIGSGANSGALHFNGSVASTSDRVINLAGSTGGATISSSGATANTLTLTSNLTAAAGNKTLTLQGTNTGSNMISGIIGDPDVSTKINLVKSEAGRWILGGANSYSGGTTINGGTLSVGASGTLGQNVVGNNVTIAGGNLLFSADSNVGSNQTITITAAGGGIGVSYTPSIFPTVTDNSGVTGGVFGINYTGTGGIGSIAGIDALFTASSRWFLGSFIGGTGTYTGSSLTAGNGSTYRLGGGGGVLTMQNNVLTGANDLLVGSTGGGSVIMSGANTYTGKTTLQNGTLMVASINSVSGGGASSSLGAPTTIPNGTIDIGSGTNAVTFNYTGSGETSDRVLNFTGTTGGVALTNSGTGNLNFTSTLTFTGSGAKAFTLGTNTDTFGGALGPIIDNGGVATVTKNGLTNSTWTLNGSNTYTGTTTVNGGVLSTSGVLSSSARITLNGSATNLAVLQGQGTITRQLGAGASRLDWPANSGFAAKGGTLTLTLTNNAGTAGGLLTWGTGGFMSTGVTPMVFGSSTANNQVELTNNFTFGDNVSSGFNRVIYVDKGVGGDTAKLSGVISIGGGTSALNGFVKDGPGTLVLSALNTYTGTTNIRAGTLIAENNAPVSGNGVFGNAATAISVGDGTTASTNASAALLVGGAYNIARPVTINNQATTGTYSLGGSTNNSSAFSGMITSSQNFAVTQVATTGSNALNISGGITGGATALTKTVTFNNIGSVNVDTVGIVDGAGGGKVAVAKSNSGTVTLSAANTYTGATTVSAGTLVLSSAGSISNSSALNINGGTFRNNSLTNYTGTLTYTSGTVSGTNMNGSLGGQIISTGKTISPGNSPGTAITTDQTWAGGGSFLFEVNDAAGAAGVDPGWDLMTGTGTLNITATSGSQFNILLTSLTLLNAGGDAANFNGASDYSWKLADFANAVTGFDATAFNVNRSAFTNSAPGAFSVAWGTTVSGGDNTQLYLVYTAIPEPATWALLAFSLTTVVVLRRRRSS